MRFLLLWALLFSAACTQSVPAQISGCTDPLATNYNAQATINDGSCTYAATNYTPILHSLLPDTLEENSALVYFGSSLWTINDGGGGAYLYRLSADSPAQILQRIYLPACTNVDWEALTQSSQYLYIGDFGNNNGTRQDLRIYALRKSELLALPNTYPLTDTFAGWTDTLHFAYADQQNFTNAPNANNFDCEAMAFYRDSLHIFSKGWLNNATKHYRLPAADAWTNDTMPFAATVADTFAVGYLVTDAAIDSATGNLVLVGYSGTTGACFAHLIYGYAESHFFSANRRRLALPWALQLGQLEGIALLSPTHGFMSAERFARAGLDIAPRLLRFDFSAFYYSAPIAVERLPLQNNLLIYPNPASAALRTVRLRLDAQGFERLRFDWYAADGRHLAGGALPAFTQSDTEIPLPLRLSAHQHLLLKISDAASGKVLAVQRLRVKE